MDDTDGEGLWLFGYGSLIWKPPPHFDKRVPGYVEGYVRRFWQASQDHRGTPEAPGRVVTLIERREWEKMTDSHPSAPPKVWGAAYHIPAPHVAAVRAYLDIREINGYTMDFRPFYTAVYPSPSFSLPSSSSTTNSSSTTDSSSFASASGSGSHPSPIHCLLYIGLPSNPQFLGPQDPQALAEHIARSRGPSGANSEYLYMLEGALRALGPESGDEHVQDLAGRVREIEGRVGGGGGRGGLEGVGKEVEGVAGVGRKDVEEEVEKVEKGEKGA